MPGFSPAPPPGSGVWWKVMKSAEIWVVTKNCDLKMENICENSNKVQGSWLTWMRVCAWPYRLLLV